MLPRARLLSAQAVRLLRIAASRGQARPRQGSPRRAHEVACALAGPLVQPGSWRGNAAGTFQMPRREAQVLLGCVSYDPSIGTIWGKMKDYFIEAGLPFDFVLFTNYEQQVRALLAGHIDIAWNGPIAHVMAQQLAEMQGLGPVISMGMRDVDCDFVSVVAVRKGTGITCVGDIAGRDLMTGASDSPQAHLVPLQWLRGLGIAPASVEAFDFDLGKHGDTAVGEIKVLEALASETSKPAAVLSRLMWDRALAGQLPSVDAAHLTARAELLQGTENQPPLFDHCQFDALQSLSAWKRDGFVQALFAMDWENPQHQEVMSLEGIRRSWKPHREEGYNIIRDALKGRGWHPGTGTASRAASGVRGICTWPKVSSCVSAGAASRNRPFRAPGGGVAFAPLPYSRGVHHQTAIERRRDLHVGVVGCGVAGLQVVRALRAKGIEVTAYDKAPDIGGLWQENYAGFGLQVPKQLFEFPDFPFERVPWGKYPCGAEVQTYIEQYADHFSLRSALRLSTAVEEIRPTGEGWTFTTRTDSGQLHENRFDYAVVCTGMYSAVKNIPDIPGQEGFQGTVVHSSNFTSAKPAVGKRVLVVGGAKSAVDCAVVCESVGAASVNLLQREAHWPTPRLLAGFIPFQYVFLSRFGTYLVSAHRGTFPDCSPATRAFRTLAWPLMKPVFALVELLFAAQFRLSGPLRPGRDVVSDFYGYAHVLDYELRDKRRGGKVCVDIGEVASFLPDGVALRDGKKIKCDLVIFGTGFRKDYSIFPAEVREALGVEEDGLYLYRHMLPPGVPRLAFVGSEIATISNIATHGLQAEWLARLLAGASQPALRASAETMRDEVRALKSWKRAWMPATASRANLVLLHQTHYHDQILKDLGVEHKRKWPNQLAEFFMPYHPMDYNGIIGV